MANLPIIEWGGSGIFGYGLWNPWDVSYPEDYAFSEDGFKTWTYPKGITLRPDVSLILGTLNFGNGRVTILYWELGVGAGLHSSVDGGKTFTLDLLIAPGTRVYNVSEHSSEDTGVFAFIDYDWNVGFAVTRDGGKTWKQVTTSIDDAYRVPVYVTSNEDVVVFNNAILSPAGDLESINVPEGIQGEEDWVLTECTAGILLHPYYCWDVEKAFMFSRDLSTWQEIDLSETACEEMSLEWPIAYSKKTGLAYRAVREWIDAFEGEDAHRYTFVYIYSSTNLVDWQYVSRIQVQDYFTASDGWWAIKNVEPIFMTIVNDNFVITGNCTDQDGFWFETLVATSSDGKDWTANYVPVDVYAVS